MNNAVGRKCSFDFRYWSRRKVIKEERSRVKQHNSQVYNMLVFNLNRKYIWVAQSKTFYKVPGDQDFNNEPRELGLL